MTGMTDEIIREMAESIKKGESVDDCLRAYWADKVAVIWTVDDVLKEASRLNKECTQNNAVTILNESFKHHGLNTLSLFDKGVSALKDKDDIEMEAALASRGVKFDQMWDASNTLSVGNYCVKQVDRYPYVGPAKWDLYDSFESLDADEPFATVVGTEKAADLLKLYAAEKNA